MTLRKYRGFRMDQVIPSLGVLEQLVLSDAVGVRGRVPDAAGGARRRKGDGTAIPTELGIISLLMFLWNIFGSIILIIRALYCLSLEDSRGATIAFGLLFALALSPSALTVTVYLFYPSERASLRIYARISFLTRFVAFIQTLGLGLLSTDSSMFVALILFIVALASTDYLCCDRLRRSVAVDGS